MRCRVLCLLLLLPLLSACGSPAVPDYFAYRNTDFAATLEGNAGGRDFRCEVHCRDGVPQRVEWSAPQALAGVALTGDRERVALTRGELRAEFDPGQLAGLLLPVRLLLAEGATVRTVRRIPGGMLLSVNTAALSCPVSFTLSEQGFPTVISCGEISFRVTPLPAG